MKLVVVVELKRYGLSRTLLIKVMNCQERGCRAVSRSLGSSKNTLFPPKIYKSHINAEIKIFSLNNFCISQHSGSLQPESYWASRF